MPLALHYAVHHFRDALTSHFVLIWLLTLAPTVIAGLLISMRRRAALPLSAMEPPAGPPARRNLADTVAQVALALFVALYIVAIFYKETFAYYDNDQLTDFSLRGRAFAPPIWPGAGRFFPLGFQEFNLLGRVTRSPWGFHFFAVAQLVVVVLALFAALKEFTASQRVLVVMAVMLVPSFVISFTGLIYPERNVLFWLAIVLLCVRGYSRTRAPIYAVGCLVATQFALYYKETVAVFVVAYALSRLWLEGDAGRRSGRPWREIARESSLSLAMLALSGVYSMLFLVTMFPRSGPSYVAAHHQALSAVLLTYLQTDWLPWILLVMLSVRLLRFIFSDGVLDPFWEPLAVGALAYFVSIIALGLASGYYMAPVDFVALLYAARIAAAWLARPSAVRTAAVAAAFTLLMAHNIAYSAFRVIERKNLIAIKAQFAEFLRGYEPHADSVELFFPYASGYHLMGLSSYLRYKGFDVAEAGGASSGAGLRVLIEGPGEFPQNHCVDYRDYVCVHSDGPPDGALIVVLPDDVASMRDLEKIGRDAFPLLAVEGCGFCAREGSWFRLLHAISPEFSTSPLPGHWLQLHVFRKGPTVSASNLRHSFGSGTSDQSPPFLRAK